MNPQYRWIDCQACGRQEWRYVTTKRCYRCSALAIMARNKACGQVGHAIRKGLLSPVAGLTCYRCGKPAKHYEHRDYSKPLDVEPVCVSCNVQLGIGKI